MFQVKWAEQFSLKYNYDKTNCNYFACQKWSNMILHYDLAAQIDSYFTESVFKNLLRLFLCTCEGAEDTDLGMLNTENYNYTTATFYGCNIRY